MLPTIAFLLSDKGVSVSFLKEKLVFSGEADDAFASSRLQLAEQRASELLQPRKWAVSFLVSDRQYLISETILQYLA